MRLEEGRQSHLNPFLKANRNVVTQGLLRVWELHPLLVALQPLSDRDSASRLNNGERDLALGD